LRFQDLDLIPELQRAVRREGYDTPTPIQQQAIPPLLAGRDLLGCAQTGTGKTAAFALPILDRLERSIVPKQDVLLRVLVLAPTRELAQQIHDNFRSYGQFTRIYGTVIFGGVGQEPQVRELRSGVDILVATPGRLLDLMGQGHVRLRDVDTLVLDEADRMLDMGFVRDVRKIVAELPKQRQTMLFSATMAPEVVALAGDLLRDPVHVSVTPQAMTVDRIAQSVFHVAKADKRALLERVLRDPAVARAIVFTRTKHGADKVTRHLDQAGIRAAALHGNKSQAQREKALAAFKSGRTRVLVATDIAARGIDVDGVTHVVNHDLPEVPEAYVHRIGRTARAGNEGVALSFCDRDERDYLRNIERLIRRQVPVA
jgi:ATP-dependent RNA helicase RhlE